MCHEKNTNNTMSIRKRLFVWSLVVIAMTATVAAGAAAPPQIIDKFEVEEDFGVRKALAMLGSQCQKNIVPSPNVDGVLAFRSLRNVTFEVALDAILGENFKYEKEGNLIKVYTKDEYKKLKEDPDRMEHKVFTLYYITAEEAATLIRPVLSAAAKIEKSTAAEKDVSTAAAGSVSGGGSGGSVGSGGGDTMALNDMIVVYDYPEYLGKAAEVIKSIDIRPRQVLVEATILSATLTEQTKFGIDWNFAAGVSLDGTAATSDLTSGDTVSRGSASTTPIGQIADGTPGAPIETTGFASSGMNGLRIGATSGSMAMFLTALESTTDVTILANPKILAVNKQEGYVQIGQRLGYVNQTTQNQSGSTTQAVSFLDTGTVLTFRPYIGNDGYVRMDIFPKDSSGVVTNNLPQETTTQVKTNIIVKDGQTIVVGGLFRDLVTTGRSQVPLLGDIPLVGALFRGTDDRTERQEVIVLLTPHIIEEPGEVDGQARAADISRKRFGAKDGLQWMDRAKLAEDHYAKAVSFDRNNDTVSAMKQLCAALRLRPTYLEAIRLKERIITEANPAEAKELERVMLEAVDQEEAPMWQRR